LPFISEGRTEAIDPWGLCKTAHQQILLPSGRSIYYPSLVKERDENKTEWWYGNGRARARIYAGKGVENMVQALARDVIAEHAIDMYKQTGKRPALTVHDELVYVVKEAEADDTLDTLQDIIKRPFIAVGFAAWLILLALAATSFNRAVRWLGGRRWQALHRAVYAVAALAILHFVWMRSGKQDFAEVWVYALVLAALMGWRLWRKLRSQPERGAAHRPL
jgi:hypothetical protein